MKDVREAVSKPRTVALYTSMTREDYYSVMEVMYVNYDERHQLLSEGQKREYPFEGYVRISEPLEIQFSAISNDEMIAKAVESLNEEERKVIDELNRKIAGIREKKSQLLALTYETPE